MNLAATDELALLQENLRRYLDHDNAFERRAARLQAQSPNRLALWRGLADIGVLGAAFPESLGGFAGDARTIALIMCELGRSLVVEPFLTCAVIAGRILQHMQAKAPRDQWIGQVIAGDRVIALAHDGGSSPFGPPSIRAQEEADGYRLSGRVSCVYNGDVAQEFLISATLDGQTEIFRCPKAALRVQPYRLMDASGAVDLRLDGVWLGLEARLLCVRPAQEVIEDALEWGLLALGAEAYGIASAANEATFRYLMQRRQFGVLIGTFQALQHRAADMKMAEEELGAAMGLAVRAMSDGTGSGRSAILSALKCVADGAGRRIGHEAIQLHGGMGVSDELNISHFARRLATMRSQLGSVSYHHLRFGVETDLTGLLRLLDSDSDRAWRAEVAAFTQKNLPARIGRKVSLGLKIEKQDYVGWQKVLAEHGLFAGAWPPRFGGQGWGLVKQLLFTQETALHDGPWISPYGVNMVGPVLYSFGSEEQKRRHLPGILSNDVWWCQGYSEPGSGSDLASLKTFAVRDGDDYVVTGAKLWTTEAHWADWMHCLVRTDRSVKPQAGISFLLIDMKSPGIGIRPIVTIDGVHHTNAVFLDNVRVPAANRVGSEGQGWAIAKFLLGNERVAIGDTGQKLRLLRHVQALHRECVEQAEMPADMRALLRAKLAEVSIQLLALCALERRFIDEWESGKPFGAEASIIKVRATEILQAITELALEIEGRMAAAYDSADLYRGANEELTPSQRASAMGYEYLYGRCWSIFGGTNEVQRNILARQILA
ncbi:MAG TPA: acyl-CoA dehydrogenase family protein [Steroidobacteraceae bacterium]|nr:acyl-CoA dehydrogenase family protein [Steroidobacteraceae bacterium]